MCVRQAHRQGLVFTTLSPKLLNSPLTLQVKHHNFNLVPGLKAMKGSHCRLQAVDTCLCSGSVGYH